MMVFLQHLFYNRSRFGAENDIFDPPHWLANIQQSKITLPICWNRNLRDSLVHFAWTAIEQTFEIIRKQVMLFLPLLFDDLFRRAPKGFNVAFQPGFYELPQ